MSQFLGHEVIEGKCHPVLLEEDARGRMQARSTAPGAKVEWHGVEEGAWHREEECGPDAFARLEKAVDGLLESLRGMKDEDGMPVNETMPQPASSVSQTWPENLEVDDHGAMPSVPMPEEEPAPPESKRGRGRPKKR